MRAANLGNLPRTVRCFEIRLGRAALQVFAADFDISSHLWYTIFEIEYREVDSFERTAGDIVH